MGKGIKKAVTGVVTLAMLSSSLSAFASSVSVSKVEVLNSATEVASEHTSLDNISLTPSQMLRVTVAVKDANAESVFATFLSKTKDASTLDNTNVQYVGQAKVSGEGDSKTATFTFRPRLTTGTYSAMAGGTEATSAVSFDYTVKEADKTMTLVGKDNSLPANTEKNATFTISGFTGEVYTGFSVYLDNSTTALASENYSVDKNDENLVLTIKNAAFTDKTKDTSIAVKLTHEGYTDATGTISITAGVYNVSWDLNGGTTSETTSNTYTDGDTLTLPAAETMSKIGYKFEGWYKESNFINKVTEITNASADLTFYAKWTAESYDVELHTNGGTIADGKNITQNTYNQTQTLPTADDITKTGHTFEGWYTDENFGTAATETSATATSKQEFWAKWTAKTYTITYDCKEGAIAENDKVESYTYGQTTQLPTPTRDGWHFEGWYTSSDFGGTVVTEIGATDIENKTFYAKWSENAPTSYEIVFKNCDGSELQKSNVDVGTTPSYSGTPTYVPTDDDGYIYTFDKWTPDIVAVSAAATYTASYNKTAKTYDITYDLKGGTAGDNAPSQYTYGTSVTLVDPTRTGYKFDGWYTEVGCTNKVTSISSSSIGNVELWAKWTANEYSIIYDMNGGGTIKDTSYPNNFTFNETGTTVTLPTTAERDGYTFGGWYTDSACSEGKKVTEFSSNVAENQTFYAKWTTNSTGGDGGSGGTGGGGGSTTPSEPSTPTTVPVVAGSLENKLNVSSTTTTTGEGATAVTSTTLTLAPETGEVLPTYVKMYKVEYDSNGILVSITEVTATTTDGGKTFTFDDSLSSGSESANIMLVSSNLTPIIGKIEINKN